MPHPHVAMETGVSSAARPDALADPSKGSSAPQMARDSEAATAHRPGAASNASGASAAPHAKQEAMDEDVGEALSEHAPRETHPPSQALPNGAQAVSYTHLRAHET